jgi:hypothetical protein
MEKIPKVYVGYYMETKSKYFSRLGHGDRLPRFVWGKHMGVEPIFLYGRFGNGIGSVKPIIPTNVML